MTKMRLKNELLLRARSLNFFAVAARNLCRTVLSTPPEVLKLN